VVLTLVPKALNELPPLFCRSCRKPVRKDCRAEVELDAEPGAVLPPKSPINFWNAELRDDKALEDRLDEESVLLISWLSLRSCTSALSAEMMSCGPYADVPLVLAAGAGVAAAGMAAAGMAAAGMAAAAASESTSLLVAGVADGGVAMPEAAGGRTAAAEFTAAVTVAAVLEALLA
jgi:hypothetical protein